MFDINTYPKKLGKNITIFQAYNNIDVFYGEGWNNHARFTKKKTSSGMRLDKVTHQSIPKHLYAQIVQEIKQCTSI